MQKIHPCLWFEGQAEEAANFYVSTFEDSRILETTYYGEGMPGTPGDVLTVTFEIHGQHFTALNGGPEFKFTEAVSFVVDCDSQAEVDRLWNALTADGGQESVCGWLKDKYGLSWQIVPNALFKLMSDSNPAKATAVTHAFMQMRKININVLQQAYDNA